MFQLKRAGFYIGGDSVAGVEVKGKSKPQILGTWRTQRGLDFNRPELLKEGLEKALTASGFRSRRISISIPDTLARTVVMDFEELPSSKKEVLEIVRARAKSEMDSDPDEDVLSFQAFGQGTRKKVLCVAAKRDIIKVIEENICQKGHSIERVSTHSLNIINLLSADGDSAVVIRFRDYITVIVFNGGAIDFYRCKSVTDDADVKRETAASFAFYCGRNQGKSISKIYLIDESGRLSDLTRDSVPAPIESPGPGAFSITTGWNGRGLDLLAAAGACL